MRYLANIRPTATNAPRSPNRVVNMGLPESIAPYQSLLTGSWMSGRNTNELKNTSAKAIRRPSQ
ncbi:hypothetical protein RSO01_93220 [Reyranella soli]|uniref:Uncharacterized protein n=1 Tax=Reyranella soli TaxID=1230389 RepID=A0A512NT68_9HYPH|nr:hypothetical protein RSO01_93220 [Reyranella soli]